MFIALNKEAPISDEEIKRALTESWEYVSAKRKDSGFLLQYALQCNAIRNNAISFFDDSDDTEFPHFCGAISLTSDQVVIDSLSYWGMVLILIGADRSGSKAWFFDFLAGNADATFGPELQKMYPFNTVTFVQPDSPVGKFLIKNAEDGGANILTYSDYFDDNLHPPETVMIRRVHEGVNQPSVYV
jgi:hypothetical protein